MLQLLICYLFRVHQIPQVQSKFGAKMPVRCFTPNSIRAGATNTLHRAFLSSTIQLPWAISTDGLRSHTKYHAPKSNSLFSVSWTRHLFRPSGNWHGIMLYVSSSRLQNTLAFLLLLSVRKTQCLIMSGSAETLSQLVYILQLCLVSWPSSLCSL